MIEEEIKKEEFIVAEEENTVEEKLKDPQIWLDFLFKFRKLHKAILESLYIPIRKASLPKEELVKVAKKIKYSLRRLNEVLQELEKEKLIIKENGVIKTRKKASICRNIAKLVYLWPVAHTSEKSRLTNVNLKLDFMLPHVLKKTWLSLKKITEIYNEHNKDKVFRETVRKRLDAGVKKGLFDRKEYNKSFKKKRKYVSRYYKLKS